MKRSKFIRKFAWIAVVVFIAVFFVVSMIVYFAVEPKNMSGSLRIDESSWNDIYEQIRTTNDLETNKFVTKVYECVSNEDSINISCIIKESDRDWSCVTVEDENAEYNYRVECFVQSNFADKNYVKQFWNVGWKTYMKDAKSLTFEKTRYVFLAQSAKAFGDIKISNSRELYYFNIYLRIIVRPGYENINFTSTKTL